MAISKAKKLENLLEQERQVKAKIRDVKAQQRDEDRKIQTRRKILIGWSIQAEIERGGGMTETQLHAILDRHLTATRDRKLFDLPE